MNMGPAFSACISDKIDMTKLNCMAFFSDPGIGEFHPLSTTHLNVCKPWDHNSELYLLTMKFVKHCIMLDPLTHIMKAGNVVNR